ncbi:MAG: type 2 lanthipeptide synthetase LanM [Acidimicrobiales bacterium]
MRSAETTDLIDRVRTRRTRRIDLDATLGFGSAYGPWLEVAVESVTAGLGRPLQPLARLAEHQLQQRLAAIAGPVLLDAFRSTAVGYERFVEGIVESGWDAVRDEAPVLDRLLQSVTLQWISATIELGRRLERDRPVLAAGFGFDVDRIVAVSGNLGDPHHGGRTVIGVRDAGGRRIAYKPRSLAPEAAFVEALAIVAPAIPDVATNQPVVAVRLDPDGDIAPAGHNRAHAGAYGWMSWVDSELDCPPGDVERFYTAAGALICVGQILGLSDVHLENLIASGRTPVVVDLECLLTPQFDSSRLDGDEGARRFFRDSVLPLGILPGSILGFGPVGVDRTGLSGRGGAPTGNWGRRWVGLGTDDIDVARQPMTVARAINLPVPLRNQRRLPPIPTAGVVDGYLRAAEALTSGRVDLPALAGVRPRVLFRMTSRYTEVIGRLLSPACLTDEAAFADALEGGPDWAGAFDDIGSTGSGGVRWQEALIEDERASMADLDVPAFWFDPAAGTVRLGGVDHGGMFRCPPLEDVERRLGALADRRDLEADVIRIALQGHRVGAAESNRASANDRPPTPQGEHDSERLALVTARDTATEIIARLIQSSIEVDGRVRWLHAASAAGADLRSPALTTGGFYDGTSGIGLVLALAAGRFDDGGDTTAAFARRCLADAWALLAPASTPLAGAALASGTSGWAYAAAVAGSHLGDTELCNQARLRALPDELTIGSGDSLDLIGGWAGVVLAAQAVAATTGDEDLAAQVAACADAVAAEIQRRDEIGMAPAHHRLSMAHGSFGISLALLRAAAPGSLAEQTARHLFDVQRSRIAERDCIPGRVHREHGRMLPDLSWCWGTAGYLIAANGHGGIGLESSGIDDRAAANAVASSNSWGPVDRLCCGTAGRLVALADHGARAMAAEATHHLVAGWKTGRLVTDAGIDVASPTLFRGLAGIAYALMSIVEPVPNVLRLDAARATPAIAAGNAATP